MSIERINDIGTVKINKHVIGTVIEKALMLSDGKVWPSTDKAKLITGIAGMWPSVSEICDNINIEERNGRLEIRINVVISFGTSIKKSTDVIFDYIEKCLSQMFNETPCKVIIYIAGVRSRHIAPRDLEVSREWN